MRDREEHCKEMFNSYLKERLGFTEIKFIEGDEPPDYYLEIHGKKYAVEVTTIEAQEEIDNEKPLTRSSVDNSYRDLAKQVEKLAIEADILNGFYLIKFRERIAQFSRIRRKIIEEMTEYVRKTQNDASAPEHLIERDCVLICSITKLHDGKNLIDHMRTVAGWIGEFACDYLQFAISEKKRKLQNIHLPKILLLLGHYEFADRAEYELCIPTLKFLDEFHTVFMIGKFNGESEGYILHTQGFDS